MQDKENLNLEEIRLKGFINPVEDIEELEPVIIQHSEDKEIVVSTLGNFSMVIGKAKSRKSFLMAMLISVCGVEYKLFNFTNNLPKTKSHLIYFDTEQGRRHVQLLTKRICRLLNVSEPDFLKVYPLRKYTPSQRLQIVEHILYNTALPGVVVIDGIRDLITSINDEEQATMISTKLMKWSEELNIHIYVVLHQNKSDNNARGHAGTELLNKAETVLSVTKSERDKNVSVVEVVSSRNIEPNPFAFEIIDGLPALIDNYIITDTKKSKKLEVDSIEDHKYYSILNSILSKNKSVKYGELVRSVKIELKTVHNISIGDNKSKDIISYCKSKGWIFQEKEKGPYVLGEYKNVSV